MLPAEAKPEAIRRLEHVLEREAEAPFLPPGHLTTTFSIVVASPRPKCIQRLDWAR